jgi:glycosyltransferase involved in cell wall biosynthesis
MQLPRITVITPNFNQEKFIEATILSVVSQGYPNLEYIIVDGGSTDGSVNIIKKYASQLAYWESKSDNGQYDAVQKGFSKATGEIMTYINSDDILAPRSLFTVAQIFMDYPQVKWLGGIPNHIDEIGRNVSIGKYEQWNKYRYLNLDFKYIQQEGVFWRTSLWHEAGGYISTKYKLASDLELWSRFFQHADMYMLPSFLGSFRTRSQNQKSLEGMSAYLAEAKEILLRMDRTEAERKVIATSKCLLYRICKKKTLKPLFNLLGFNRIQLQVNNYPRAFSFERTSQKFILE